MARELGPERIHVAHAVVDRGIAPNQRLEERDGSGWIALGQFRTVPKK